jgi:hypothetical protein
MGKPRRSRGGRSNWQPKPPLDAEPPASTETLPETSEAESSPADAEPVSASAPEEGAVAPAGPEPAPAEPRAEPANPDSVANAANPPEADRDAEARQEIRDDRPAADHAVPAPDLAPVAVRAAGPTAPNRIVFAPDRIDIVEIGSTIARYVQGEGEAALAHFRALSDVRTPADLIRLNVNEAQRAADASLTCWVTVMGKASRVVALR